jgi:hypothetical protein
MPSRKNSKYKGPEMGMLDCLKTVKEISMARRVSKRKTEKM